MMRAAVPIALVLFFWVPGVGRAQTAAETDTQAAKIHYQAGEQYYLRGHYPEAIGEFQEAYRLSRAAALLYNISQAYDRMGDLPHAREYLVSYIDSGQADPAEIDALREKVRALDKKMGEDTASPPPHPVATPAPPAAVPKPAPLPAPIAEAPRPWKTWKWIAAGAGAGCLVLSLLFVADEQNQAKTLENAAKNQSSYIGNLPDAYARGQRDQNAAIAFGIAGGALAATGVVLFFLDARAASERPPQAQVAPIVGPGTAGAAAVWRF